MTRQNTTNTHHKHSAISNRRRHLLASNTTKPGSPQSSSINSMTPIAIATSIQGRTKREVRRLRTTKARLCRLLATHQALFNRIGLSNADLWVLKNLPAEDLERALSKCKEIDAKAVELRRLVREARKMDIDEVVDGLGLDFGGMEIDSKGDHEAEGEDSDVSREETGGMKEVTSEGEAEIAMEDK